MSKESHSLAHSLTFRITHSFICIPSPSRSVTHSLLYFLTPWFDHSLTHSPLGSPTPSLLTHFSMHSLLDSPACSLSVTNSFTHKSAPEHQNNTRTKRATDFTQRHRSIRSHDVTICHTLSYDLASRNNSSLTLTHNSFTSFRRKECRLVHQPWSGH